MDASESFLFERPHGTLADCDKFYGRNVAAHMTFDEMAASLPNGVHDAELEMVALDFARREARLELNLWVGDDRELEAYRRAQVLLTGLQFWVSEPPDPRYFVGPHGPVRISGGVLNDARPKPLPALPPIPQSAFANWFFVDDWNAYIYFAAEAANLTWLDD